jgi:hypothetical protein
MDMNAWRIAPPWSSGAELNDLHHTGDQSAATCSVRSILTLDQADALVAPFRAQLGLEAI